MNLPCTGASGALVVARRDREGGDALPRPGRERGRTSCSSSAPAPSSASRSACSPGAAEPGRERGASGAVRERRDRAAITGARGRAAARIARPRRARRSMTNRYIGARRRRGDGEGRGAGRGARPARLDPPGAPRAPEGPRRGAARRPARVGLGLGDGGVRHRPARPLARRSSASPASRPASPATTSSTATARPPPWWTSARTGSACSPLEPDGRDTYRENPRCSQGTGNFLRQLVERFGLTPEEADDVATGAQAAPLSGRCPVILKTDMTHLANKGEDRGRILAGLFDAICENVQVLVKAHGPRDVTLAGGVGQSRRVRENFRAWLARRGMSLRDAGGGGALPRRARLRRHRRGAAGVAAAARRALPGRRARGARPPAAALDALGKVKRLAGAAARGRRARARCCSGSTSARPARRPSRSTSRRAPPAWEAYVRTARRSGRRRPEAREGASRRGRAGLARSRASASPAPAARSSARSWRRATARDRVHVLNEIAAHAEGARAYDPRVDTIFEIGGQDAKYIRLEGGRVVDAAMNEACSAGTGSFIEEQGRRLGGLGAAELGREAIEADGCVALGQHCAVFMAEILDEAAAAGADRRHVIAGLYESVIQNYLNRVKGQRSVGQVDLLPGHAVQRRRARGGGRAPDRRGGDRAALARHGGRVRDRAPRARGARRGRRARRSSPARFLAARVERKEVFVCKSTQGCGGTGNSCRIDRLRTVVDGQRQAFTWGGACSLYDKGTRTKKLPDGAPDPFRARADAVEALARAGRRGPHRREARRDGRGVPAEDALPVLRDVLPRARARPRGRPPGRARRAPARHRGGERAVLRADAAVPRHRPGDGRDRGGLRVPPDAPRAARGEGREAHLALPHRAGRAGRGAPRPREGAARARPLPRHPDRRGVPRDAAVPRRDPRARRRGGRHRRRRRSPPRTPPRARSSSASTGTCSTSAATRSRSAAARGSCRSSSSAAPTRSTTTSSTRTSPRSCASRGPSRSRWTASRSRTRRRSSHGAFWSYTQRILRAAHEIRRTPGVYSIFTSNYACGPDSFTLHHYTRLMEGKPFAIIETDGHAGDAGHEDARRGVPPLRARGPALGRERLRAAGAAPLPERADAPRDRGARQPRPRPADGPGGGRARGGAARATASTSRCCRRRRSTRSGSAGATRAARSACR